MRDQGGQLLGEREIAVGRGARSLGDPGALGVVPLGLRGELGEEAVLRGEAAGLLRAEQELAASRDHAVVRRLSESDCAQLDRDRGIASRRYRAITCQSSAVSVGI